MFLGNLIFQKTIINNTEYKKAISKKVIPKTEFQKVSVKINSTHSIELETKLMLPVTLNKKHVTQYPLLLSV